MNPEHKKYILENANKISIQEIACNLGIRERNVKKVIRMEGQKRRLPSAAAVTEPKISAKPIPVKKTIRLTSVALIIILGFAVYANSLNGKFIYDDETLITKNAYIKDWSILPKVFTEDIGMNAGHRSSFYRPLQIITYAMDYHTWKLNVVGYHLTNIILHILVALCVYWLINILFDDKTVSILTAVLFVVHPIHTTVVSYISTRAESLYLLFMLISFIFYIKSIHKEGVTFFLIMISSYMFSLLSKENALIFPVLLALYHYTFKEKVKMRKFLSVSGVAVFYMVLRTTVLRHLMTYAVVIGSLVQRLPGFFAAIATYVRLMLLPFGLHIEYGTPLFNFTDPKAICGLTILTALIFCAIKTIKTNRLLSFSLSWFLITLLPISNLYPLNAYMSENWLYLPSIGFFLVMGGLLGSFYKKEKFRTLTLIFASCLLLFYSYLTVRQNKTWREPIAFYERTLKYSPGSSKMYNNLASKYSMMGKKEEAIDMYKKALEIDPTQAASYNNLGNTYYNMGKKEEAIDMYKKALEIDPTQADAYTNLGVAYYNMGKKEEAIPLYKKAIEANPNYANAYNNLGLAYYEMGKKEEAIPLYKKAIEANPNYANAYNNLGAACYELGRREDAAAAFKRALEINPYHADARRNLAIVETGSK